MLVILGIMLGVSYTIYDANREGQQAEITQQRLTLIRESLDNFWNTHGRLPCPADLFAAAEDPAYGEEDLHIYTDAQSANYILCDNESGHKLYLYVQQLVYADDYVVDNDAVAFYIPPNEVENLGNYLPSIYDIPGNIDVADANAPGTDFARSFRVVGALPYKTLGLPRSVMLDGWGNKFHYATLLGNTYAPWADVSSAYTDIALYPDVIIAPYDAGNTYSNASARYAVASMGANAFGAVSDAGLFNNVSMSYSTENGTSNTGLYDESGAMFPHIRNVLMNTEYGISPKRIYVYGDGFTPDNSPPLVDDYVIYGSIRPAL